MVVATKKISGMPVALHRRQAEFVSCNELKKGYVGGRGAGKALAITTEIPTPDGWKTMGEIRRGDIVFDEHGEQCRVIATTPVMDDRPCYRVTFSDGTEIVADENHEWLTEDHAFRKSLSRCNDRSKSKQSPRVVTTGEIRSSLTYLGRELNHAVRVCDSIKCDSAHLPIMPYTLGAWLGDGTSSGPYVTTADTDMIVGILKDGYGVRDFTRKGLAVNFTVFKRNRKKEKVFHPRWRSQDYLRYAEPNFRQELRGIGVLGSLDNKHIPTLYLRSSVKQRLELLKGLMDSDGTCGESGKCEFTSISRRLADDVCELLVSLGLKASVTVGRAMLDGRYIGPKYRIHFTSYFPVFKIRRKLDNQKSEGKQSQRQKRRYIESVRRIKSVPVKCIQVDSPSSMYLASRSMIPTHNSFILCYDMIKRAKNGRLYMIAAPTYPMLSDATMRSFIHVASNVMGGRLIRAKHGSDVWAAVRTFEPDRMPSYGKAEFIFRTASDPEKLRGPNLSGLGLDEASLMSKEALDIAMACLREGGDMGTIAMAFTPKGRQHWTYDEFFEKKLGPDGLPVPKPYSKIFHSRQRENVYLNPMFLAAMEEQYGKGSRLGRQELEGNFIDIEGLMFTREWFSKRIVAYVPPECRRIRYWDKANTEAGGCYTVGVLVARDLANKFYIEDVIRGQWSYAKRNEIIKTIAESDFQLYGNLITTWIEQEPGSGGQESAQISMKELGGYAVYVDRVQNSKVERAIPLACQAEIGNVYMLSAPWNDDFLEEITAFPEGNFKDQVDAASGALNKLRLGGFRQSTVENLLTYPLSADKAKEEYDRLEAKKREELALQVAGDNNKPKKPHDRTGATASLLNYITRQRE